MDEDEDNIVAALRRGEDGWEYAAADEIEALRAENARLKEAQKKLEEQFHKVACEEADAQKEIARLRDLLDNALGWLDDKEHDKPLLSVDNIRAARAAMGESDND